MEKILNPMEKKAIMDSALATVTPGMESGSSNNVSLVDSRAKMSNAITFNLVNGSAGALVVRIGSPLGLAGSYEIYGGVAFGVPASACDEPLFTDDFGAGVKKVQGFSQQTIDARVKIDTVKIQQTAGDTSQLQKPLNFKRIFQDLSIDTAPGNVAITAEKSDFKSGLVVFDKRPVYASNCEYIEYEVLAGASVSITLGFSALGNVHQMVSIK